MIKKKPTIILFFLILFNICGIAAARPEYKKANNTWGDTLNNTGKYPHSGFMAFYINTKDPKKVIYKELVNDISINYPYDEFNGIDSEDFGGYWVGELEFDTETTKQILINQGHSKARLIIDGYIIYEGGRNKELVYNFKTGKHKVEVEYINNWHTTEFSLRITDQVKYYSLKEISEKLQVLNKDEIETNLVSVYESSEKDLSLVVNIKKSNKSQVLFLTSYSPVNWQISNPHNVKISAVVYNSHAPGALVTGDIKKGTAVFATKERFGRAPHNPYPKCSCRGGHFHCEEDGPLSSIQAIENITASKLNGLNAIYSADSIAVPEIIIDEDYMLKLNSIIEKNKKLEESCKKENSPDFENIFK